MKSKYNIEKYKGQSINKWTVLSFSHIDSKGQQYWNCKCNCGLEKPVRATHVIRNLNKGCRKCRGQSLSTINSPYWKGGTFISSSLFTKYKLSAYHRKIPFLITIEDLEQQWLKQNGKCYYTDIILSLPINDRDRSFTASIDRKNSKLPYEKSNIQWVLKDINFMKLQLSEDRFIELCKTVYLQNINK